MTISPLPVTGAALVHTRIHQDTRGRFARLFCQNELSVLNNHRPIQQVNYSLTRECGTVRGLHYQSPPHAEDKAIRCLRGRVFDVIVDLRVDSVTFGRWTAVELSADGMEMVYIPKGCAHGFQALETGVELLYLHTDFYAPPHESGFRYDSPKLGIAWPLAVGQVSERDARLPVFDDTFGGIRL
jgi:dTDP-4-dehydrorhamnose 3,5-epimerase